jgi:hypothetical protein
MLRNYFTSAIKILARNQFYSLINIDGLELAWLTLNWHAFKAARSNQKHALKYA